MKAIIERKRTITIGGAEYTMPKITPDAYMDYLEVRDDVFTSEETNKRYTKAQFVRMMEAIVSLYGNQFTMEALKNPDTGLSVSEIIMEFAMIEAVVGGEVDRRVTEMRENFPEGT